MQAAVEQKCEEARAKSMCQEEMLRRLRMS